MKSMIANLKYFPHLIILSYGENLIFTYFNLYLSCIKFIQAFNPLALMPPYIRDVN